MVPRRMRGTLFLSTIVFLPLLLASPRGLEWTQVNAPGFNEHAGPYTGQEAFDLTVFDGQLYLGMEGMACARIWRTRAGVTAPSTQADWEQVVSNGFDGATDCASWPPTTDNDHIDSLEPFGGYIYASTAMQTSGKRGTQVFRSPTGDPGSWQRVNDPGFGQSTNHNFKDMIEFDGLLCGGTRNTGATGVPSGAQIWCSDGTTPDPARPGQLLWTQRNHNGFGNLQNIETWSSATHDGALYFGVEATCEDELICWDGSIWRTRNLGDSAAWEMVFAPADVGLSAHRVDVLQSYDGRLFVGMQATDLGAIIFSSASGDRFTWKLARAGGFGPTTGRYISDASTVLSGSLHVATFDETQGVAVWSTRDGYTWTLSAPHGFGDPATFAAELIGFNGQLYAWTSNYIEGQGVWRGE